MTTIDATFRTPNLIVDYIETSTDLDITLTHTSGDVAHVFENGGYIEVRVKRLPFMETTYMNGVDLTCFASRDAAILHAMEDAESAMTPPTSPRARSNWEYNRRFGWGGSLA